MVGTILCSLLFDLDNIKMGLKLAPVELYKDCAITNIVHHTNPLEWFFLQSGGLP
jgi:hypothetical protein